jgi:deazaflavin-dependent oxidoreductase (nitroreductase family)
MPQKISDPQPPRDLKRMLLRLPIWCYRLGCGWLLGKRFLLPNHLGRRSGLPRQTVLEVVKYDADTDTYFIASGFGKQSDWYRNLIKMPAARIQVGNRRMNVMARPLTPEQSGEVMVDYARRYPKAARSICCQVGYQVDGSEDDYRAVGREAIPFVELRQVDND